VRKVKSGEVDFGVVIGPLSADDLFTEPLMTDSFCLVSREDHPLASRAQVAWRELDGERLVMLDHASGSRPIIDAALEAHHVSANIVQELGHPSTVFGLVQAGIGVSVLPWLAMPLPAGSSLVARPLVPRAERTVELVRRRDRSLSPAADAVWNLIHQVPGRTEDLR
jgi:DNA-binding transcriptional LysR family regulator